MRKDESQIIIKRMITSAPFLIFLFIIFLFFTISTARIYLQSKKIYSEKSAKEMLLKIEEEKNKELQQKTSQLQTEQGREKILREKFQIKKPGETVAIILNPESPKSALEKQNNRNAWNKILNWWFGK